MCVYVRVCAAIALQPVGRSVKCAVRRRMRIEKCQLIRDNSVRLPQKRSASCVHQRNKQPSSPTVRASSICTHVIYSVHALVYVCVCVRKSAAVKVSFVFLVELWKAVWCANQRVCLSKRSSGCLKCQFWCRNLHSGSRKTKNFGKKSLPYMAKNCSGENFALFIVDKYMCRVR